MSNYTFQTTIWRGINVDDAYINVPIVIEISTPYSFKIGSHKCGSYPLSVVTKYKKQESYENRSCFLFIFNF